MRIPFVALLMILAVPMMGSDCYVSTRVGGPPPPADGTNPPPPNGGGGGGGVIIVTSGDPIASPPNADALLIDRQLVVSALATSVWAPPASRPLVDDPGSPDRRSVVAATARIDSLPVAFAVLESATAVPEPSGLLLFFSGLAVALHSLRTRRDPGRRLERAGQSLPGSVDRDRADVPLQDRPSTCVRLLAAENRGA